MERVLNARQRNQAFSKFLVLFLFAMAMIVTAVYFDFRIPVKENIYLRDKIRTYEKQSYQQQEVITAMNTTKKLLDSMGKMEQFNALLDRDITRQLEILKQPAQQKNSTYSAMNQEVFNLLYDYHELNKKLLHSKDVMQKVEELKNELNLCQARLAEAERDLDVYRRSSTLGL